MSLDQLINRLKEKQRHRIEELRQKAAAEAEAARQQCDTMIAALHQDHMRRLEQAVGQESESLLAGVRCQCRKESLEAEGRLTNRLQLLAVRLLASLRQGDYPAVFSSLAAEIPDRHWDCITVNPEDTDLAAQHFPESKIQKESDICGGLIAESTDSRITVCNTFEKRLEKCWPQLLPVLLKEVHSLYVADG